MGDNLSIWRLETCANEYTSISVKSDFKYFRTHFIGKPMTADWAQPEIEIFGKSKKTADFMSWGMSVVLVSEKAKNLLEPVLGSCVEFLPFQEIKGKPYFAMNVVRVEPNLLDLNKTQAHFSIDEPKYIIALDSAVFVDPLPTELPPIFKIEYNKKVNSEVFVTRPFVDVVVQHQLIGIELADPSKRAMPFILDRKSQNVVPGIVPCAKKQV